MVSSKITVEQSVYAIYSGMVVGAGVYDEK
jgi:hypothetical protein